MHEHVTFGAFLFQIYFMRLNGVDDLQVFG